MENAWNQNHIGNNSHLLVFTKIKSITTDLSEAHLANTATITGATREQLKGYEDMLTNFISGLSESDADIRAREQVFLALGNVISFLAEKHIDACPVGGFNKEGVNTILNLNQENLESVVLLPI